MDTIIFQRKLHERLSFLASLYNIFKEKLQSLKRKGNGKYHTSHLEMQYNGKKDYN